MRFGRHLTKKRAFVLTTLIVLYGLLWFLTYQFGRPQVRAAAINGLHTPPRFAGWLQQTNRFNDHSYSCDTHAYTPFLVYVNYGWQGGPLYGDGGSAVYLWFFGGIFRIRELNHWES